MKFKELFKKWEGGTRESLPNPVQSSGHSFAASSSSSSVPPFSPPSTPPPRPPVVAGANPARLLAVNMKGRMSLHTKRFSDEPGACLGSLAAFSPNFEWEGSHTELFSPGRKLGEGAFGAVFEATLLASSELFAAKVIELGGDETFDDLMHEIDLLRLCSHPNIIQLYDCMAIFFPSFLLNSFNFDIFFFQDMDQFEIKGSYG